MSVFFTGITSHQLTQGREPLSERKLDNVTPLFKTFRWGFWGIKLQLLCPFFPVPAVNLIFQMASQSLAWLPPYADDQSRKDINGREKWHSTSQKQNLKEIFKVLNKSVRDERRNKNL